MLGEKVRVSREDRRDRSVTASPIHPDQIFIRETAVCRSLCTEGGL